MEKDNYFAWNIDIDSFPQNGIIQEQLKFLIGFAVLAPSGHNSQPWEFSIEGDSIFIWVNKERSLSASDPLGRQLMISVGCALENLLVAADYYGFNADIIYSQGILGQGHIVKVSFKKISSSNKDSGHIAFQILNRCTNRNEYSIQAPPALFTDKLHPLSNEEFKIDIVVDEKRRFGLADVALNAQIEIMDDDSFRKELSHYVKSNFTGDKVGMPGFTLGIPAPISIFASKLIQKINLSKKTKGKDENLLKNFTPAFIVISSAKDDRRSWIISGQLLERIWLMAERDRLSCSPLAAPVQVGEYYKEVQNILGIKFRPQVFLRLGFARKSAKHSPRFNVQDVIR